MAGTSKVIYFLYLKKEQIYFLNSQDIQGENFKRNCSKLVGVALKSQMCTILNHTFWIILRPMIRLFDGLLCTTQEVVITFMVTINF